MSQAPLTTEQMRRALQLVALHGSVSAAARAENLPRQTLAHQVTKARKQGIAADKPRVRVRAATIEVPDLPSSAEPLDELIDRRTRSFERLQAAEEARDLVPIRVRCDGPYGILHFGDPHIDDPGCNWPLLRHCVDLVQRTDGLFAGNVGDSSNNWIGRLARLYANQDVTSDDTLRLIEWLMNALPWLYVIGGNHDVWSGSTDPLRWLARQAGVLYEWHGARLALVPDAGETVRLHIRHKWRGNSIYNAAHGIARAARFSGDPDHIAMGGHIHTAAYNILPFRNGAHITHAIQVGTFKYYDSHAKAEGFDQNNLAAVVTVINPTAPRQTGLVTTFWDVDEGADYLRYLRRAA